MEGSQGFGRAVRFSMLCRAVRRAALGGGVGDCGCGLELVCENYTSAGGNWRCCDKFASVGPRERDDWFTGVSDEVGTRLELGAVWLLVEFGIVASPLGQSQFSSSGADDNVRILYLFCFAILTK